MFYSVYHHKQIIDTVHYWCSVWCLFHL